MIDQFEIGVITSTHGLKGEVKVYPMTDDVARFEDLKDVLLEAKGEPVRLKVERVRFFKGRPILKFEGLDRIEDVEAFRGRHLLVEREDAIPLEKNEFYIGDLIGSRVTLEDGSDYGELKDILRTGANDVYEIRRPDGSTTYLPSISDVILSVDPAQKTVVVRPMKEI